MNKKCEQCTLEAEWQQHYILAVQRFDKSLRTAITITMISVIVALLCIIITAYCAMKVINFINGFEYVEETTYSIEQDDKGINTAIIGGERNEVSVYGTDDH